MPKSLDETYDRIFFAIPNEDRPFVHHVLQWIIYHNDLYHGEGIPVEVLIQAVESSLARLMACHPERLHNVDTIRELCGCLINTMLEESDEKCYKSLVISLAHYTVREYLDSARAFQHFVAYFNIRDESVKQKLMEITFLEAHGIESDALWEMEVLPYGESAIHKAAGQNFSPYCVVSALVALCDWSVEVSQRETVCTLALDLLGLSKPSYKTLGAIALYAEGLTNFEGPHRFTKNHFWSAQWHPDFSDTVSVHMYNVLSLVPKSDRGIFFMEKFLLSRSTKRFLQKRLRFETEVHRIISTTNTHVCLYVFDGTIVEFVAQTAFGKLGELKLLLEHGVRLYDPSRILLFYIGNHYHSSNGNGHDECSEYCPVERLLELGADPNMTEYQITPLQIAVALWDLEGVDRLLRAGADLNNIGDAGEALFEEGTFMARFNGLHNASSLYINMKFPSILKCYFARERADNVKKIRALLIQHGAKVSIER